MVSAPTVWQHQECDSKDCKELMCWCYEGWCSSVFLVQNPTFVIRKIHLKQHRVHPYLAADAYCLGVRCFVYNRSRGHHRVPALEWRRDTAGKPSQTALGETGWQCLGCVTGLCMYWVLGASVQQQYRGVGNPHCTGSGPWVVLPGLLCQTGGRDRSALSSLSPHYQVQEFALPWNGAVETGR